MSSVARIAAFTASFIALAATTAHAQVITGRVVDTTGAAIAQARVVVATASDSAERIVVTDSRGRFTVNSGTAAVTLSAQKIGYSPGAPHLMLSRGAEPRRIVLALVPVTRELAAVRVETNGGCFDLDDPRLPVPVRESVWRAQDMIRDRRLAEIHYSFNVTTRREAFPAGSLNDLDMTARRAPGVLMVIREDAAPTDLPDETMLAVDQVRRLPLPVEGTIVSPTFLDRLCFESAAQTTRAGFAVRFREKTVPTGRLAIEGSLTFAAPAAAITGVEYRYVDGRTPLGAARVAFRSITLGAVTYPVIARREIEFYQPLSANIDRRVVEVFTYSLHKRGWSPIR